MVLAKELKTGNYVLIDGEPCKILNIMKSKTGRHGSVKLRMEVAGIFDEKKRIVLKPGTAPVEVPIIQKGTAQVISTSGTIAQLMDLADYSTFEALIPDELRGKLDSGKEVTYWKVGNKIALKEIKG